jgi:hypothetical protein
MIWPVFNYIAYKGFDEDIRRVRPSMPPMNDFYPGYFCGVKNCPHIKAGVDPENDCIRFYFSK